LNPFKEYAENLMRLSNQIELTVKNYRTKKSRVQTLKEIYDKSVLENNHEKIIKSQGLLERAQEDLNTQKKLFDNQKKEILDSISNHFKNIVQGKLIFSRKEIYADKHVHSAINTHMDSFKEIYDKIKDLDINTSNIEKYHADIQTLAEKVSSHILNILMQLNVEELRAKSA